MCKTTFICFNRMKIFLLCLITLVTGNLFSQSIFNELTAVQFGDSILINWTLKGGALCENMELQRSVDLENYEPIYIVAGACGATSDQYYNYIDSEDLKNATIYHYRVTASSDFFVSDTISLLFINAGNNQIFIYPNPSINDFNITVDNTYVPPFLIQIYDATGKQINGSSVQYANNFVLNRGTLADGVYILKITTEDRLMINKPFVVGN